MPYSFHERTALRSKLARDDYDFVIVGGGIIGAGIARDASMRGFRVALLERHDFGSGTSSRSSGLVHGGLRYLEQAEFGLVFESLSERAKLAKLARHLVRPLPFILPVYRDDERSMATLRLGLSLYDALALFRNHETHRGLSIDEVTRALPFLETQGLLGGLRYYDYQVDDGRLTLENILSAVEDGCDAISYARVKTIEYTQGKFDHVTVEDVLSKTTFPVRGRILICAAGPWTDHLVAPNSKARARLRPTKGVHLVVEKSRLPIDHAVVLRHPHDRRVHFALPHHDHSVIGTTDTDFNENPDEVYATSDDILYLLASASRYFPKQHLTPRDVVSTWAGLRPLLAQGDLNHPSEVSREHRIESRDDGVIVITGGKLTTYRKMAEECVDIAMRRFTDFGGLREITSCSTSTTPLPGAHGLKGERDLDTLIEQIRSIFSSERTARHLARIYGVRAIALCDMTRTEPDLAKPLLDDSPFVWAEVLFALREEMAIRLDDILVRRIEIFDRTPDQGLALAKPIAERMAHELDWNREQTQLELDRFFSEHTRNNRWRNEISTSENQP